MNTLLQQHQMFGGISIATFIFGILAGFFYLRSIANVRMNQQPVWIVLALILWLVAGGAGIYTITRVDPQLTTAYQNDVHNKQMTAQTLMTKRQALVQQKAGKAKLHAINEQITTALDKVDRAKTRLHDFNSDAAVPVMPVSPVVVSK